MTEQQIKNATKAIMDMRIRQQPKPYQVKGDDRYSKRLKIDAIVSEHREQVKEVWE